MKQNTAKFLPLIIIFFAAIGVLAYLAKNQKPKTEIKPEIVNPADLKSDNLVLSPTPTPSSFFFSNEPAALPTTSEVADPKDKDLSSVSDQSKAEISPEVRSAKTVTTTTTRVCTPVYGMADTCTEHIVVDTGAESTVAYSLSAFSYLAGLIAFVKSKKD